MFRTHSRSFLPPDAMTVTATWYFDDDDDIEDGNLESEKTEITVYADDHCVSFNLTTDPNRTFSIRTYELLDAIGHTWAAAE